MRPVILMIFQLLKLPEYIFNMPKVLETKVRNIAKQNDAFFHITARRNISIPSRYRSGHVQSSQQQGMMACLPKVRKYRVIALFSVSCFSRKWVIQGSHHLLVVWVKGLLNQRELLSTQLPVGVDKLGKLHTQKQVNKSDIIYKSFHRAIYGFLTDKMQCRQRVDHYYCASPCCIALQFYS